eukprot:1159547-Pelagomonas_calceolata.AAC.5
MRVLQSVSRTCSTKVLVELHADTHVCTVLACVNSDIRARESKREHLCYHRHDTGMTQAIYVKESAPVLSQA